MAEELGQTAGFSLRRVLLVVAFCVTPLLLFASVGFGLGYRLERTVGDSMNPALMSGHHWIGKVIGPGEALTRGEIVSFEPTADQAAHCNGQILPGSRFVKRIVGLPGDLLSDVDHRVEVDGLYLPELYLRTPADGGWAFASVRVPPGDYYLLGDDRAGSCDSRIFGPVARRQIKDRLVVSLPA